MESAKRCSTAPAVQQDHVDRSQLDHDTEARIFSICTRAGVSCIGIQRGFGVASDLVLFQPTVTTLAVPLAEFANPETAIELIKGKLAQSGFHGGDL
jgi:hypothetical protein